MAKFVPVKKLSESEFNELFKIGALIQIRTYDTRPSRWNSEGKMDELMGTVVQISNVGISSFTIKEDPGWVFESFDIEGFFLEGEENKLRDPNAAFKVRTMLAKARERKMPK